MIAWQDVSKTFIGRDGQPVPVLGGFSASVARGSLLALLGPTGCGKTTLLRLLAGLERPDAGRVHRPGPVALMPQQHSLFPWLRLRDNLALPARFAGRRAEAAQLEALLTLVGLEGRGGAFPHECSGGMQQRAMLARLLAGSADCWLLDEPFAAVDERTRHGLQALLLRLRAERALSVVLVTHSLDEALYCADRILVLGHGGRIVDDLTVALPTPRDRLANDYAALVERLRRAFEATIAEAADAG
jgi:NitT/TauT family transport system ATP-binding protein